MRLNLINFIIELETTKTTQRTGRLASEDGRRCALGVACDMLIASNPDKFKWVDIWGQMPQKFLGFYDSVNRPGDYDGIRNQLQIPKDRLESIHESNDYGKTFKEIAQMLIEKELTSEEKEFLTTLRMEQSKDGNGHEIRADRNEEEGYSEEGTPIPSSRSGSTSGKVFKNVC